jgi:hypothetical protein
LDKIIAIVALIIYVIYIVTALLSKKGLEKHQEKNMENGLSAGEIVEKIFKRYSDETLDETEEHGATTTDIDFNEMGEKNNEMVAEDELLQNDDEGFDADDEYDNEYDEYEELEDEDEDDEQVKYKRFDYSQKKRNFNFESNFKEDEIKEINEVLSSEDKVCVKEFYGVEKVEGSNKFRIDRDSGKILLSEDIYASNSCYSQAIAAYLTYKYFLMETKPVKYKILSLLLFIPRAITQVGWSMLILYVFGDYLLTPEMAMVISTVIGISVLLSALDLCFPKFIANYTLDEMVNAELILSTEIDDMADALKKIYVQEITRNFTLLKIFMSKVLGYKI